jgi:hypothetical protein
MPFAVPGRWRQMTMPAVVTLSPSREALTCALDRTCAGSFARHSFIG